MLEKIVAGDREDAISKKWSAKFDPAFDSDEFAGNIGSRRFRNPSAYHVNNASREVVHYVLTGEKGENLDSAIADLCQLIALWSTPPSVTLAPFTQLRSIIASTQGGFDANSEEAKQIGSRVDEMTLLAFEHYVESREKLNSIRYNELKRKTNALERAFNNAEEKMGEF
jgi:hypothetical protein